MNKKDPRAGAKSPDDKEEKKKAAETAKTDAGSKTEEKAASGPAKKEEPKQPTESELMKLYLEQAFARIKKLEEEKAELAGQLETKETQLAKLRDGLSKQTDEYDNFRRRTAAEKEALSAEAAAKAVSALLPAFDSLERALPFAQSNPESFTKGVEMTLKQLSEGFKSLGVEEIEAEGKEFDPAVHNAVMHEENGDVKGTVVTQVFQKGYKIGDRVVRHSVVKVAN